METLKEAARAILLSAEPPEKIRQSGLLAAAWRQGDLPLGGTVAMPDRPGRPARPLLLRPGDMPRRKVGGSVEKRIALLHALAHIELNAIDLAWDIVARFAGPELPRAFYDDWVKVAAEEALHFDLISQRLAILGAAYGDLPAHDGLWRAASDTAHDVLARLAIVPLVLEARGLDVTPTMIADLTRIGDAESAAVLQRIYDDEIGHVASGSRWFNEVARHRGLEPAEAWQHLVRQHFRGSLKKPFNRAARDEAGLPVDFYEPIAG
ncbi:MAG TPA: ferritin-like domain-containing protein [Dongiaceae bacterium]|nr:ferritin-like domain-containing protein [Dongiaceae bacterium]